MVSVKRISKSFGARSLWENISLDVERGQLLALTGRSGAGKTTLLNCIGLLESVDSGEICIGDKDITKLGSRGTRRFRRDQLGYLFQNYALIENATLRDNLDVALVGRRKRSERKSYDAILERVGLGGRAKDKIYLLSGGEQQRVALARLLVKQPSVVLADEPTGALDRENADLVIEVLRDMASAGCAVIIATHNQHVEDACDVVFKI
ncbi:ATP-binding cassette domain-containing protein [Streptosporangium sp. NPDC051022]|uniref:ATP-binding cassette domain-containing protein n=1 Tax=Streptosporangium sp. NPDC051022 TaxID=3155752 RepID=UPI003416AA1A